MSNHVHAKYQKLWNAIKSYEVLSVWKDTQYFIWRYEKNPDHTFDYFALESNDELLCFAVVYPEEDTVIICELMVSKQDILVGSYFVNKIVAYYLGKKKTALAFIGLDNGFYSYIFQQYEKTPYFRYRFCCKVLDRSDRLNEFFTSSANWNITYGDIDNL